MCVCVYVCAYVCAYVCVNVACMYKWVELYICCNTQPQMTLTPPHTPMLHVCMNVKGHPHTPTHLKDTHTLPHTYVVCNYECLQLYVCVFLEHRHTISRYRRRDLSLLQGVAGCCRVLQDVAVCCSMLQYVAVCCSMLQCIAICCNMLQ